jgi:YD repeat-containing protein
LYGYDAIGNLVTKTDANGATITYAYDAKRLRGDFGGRS